MMYKTKILILGPPQCGKTTIANYLADAAEVTGGEYRPTFGVRIVEFESNELELNGRNIDAEVELWDCSGDRRFEPCWPAIQKGTHGVILVCNPEKSEHAKQLEQWYGAFVHGRGVDAGRVIVLAHERPPAPAAIGEPHSTAAGFALPARLSHVQCVATNIEADGEHLRLEFNNFLCTVIAAIAAAQQ